MATVIGRHWYYTKESEIRDQIVQNRGAELSAARRTGDTQALENQLLADYGWDQNPSSSQISRIRNAIQNTLAYGKRDFHTSEDDICRHILMFHANDLSSKQEDQSQIATSVFQAYGWEHSSFLTRSSRTSRVNKAIQLALAYLKTDPDLITEVCRRASTGRELDPEEYKLFSEAELRVLTTAPRCFYNIATRFTHVNRGSFKDRMRRWNTTVQRASRSAQFYRREIARAHNFLTSPAKRMDSRQVIAKVRPFIPEYAREPRPVLEPSTLLGSDPLAEHMREGIERDMRPSSPTNPYEAFQGCHLEDIYTAYHQYIGKRATEKHDKEAFHSFVREMKKGKKQPEALFQKYESSIRRLLGRIDNPEAFVQAVLENRAPAPQEIADLKAHKRIVIWLYEGLHGIDDVRTGQAISDAFDIHFEYFRHRNRIVGTSEKTSEFIRQELQGIMRELQNPEYIRGTNEGIRRLRADNEPVELAFQTQAFQVPEIVLRDYDRGTPQIRLEDGPHSRALEGLTPESSGELSEREDVQGFINGISEFCAGFAERKSMSESLRQDLFENLLFLESQSVRNRAGTALHLGIDPLTLLTQWNSSMKVSEGESVHVAWNEREGHFDVTLKQPFAVRLHETRTNGEDLRPTGILEIESHFRLVPNADHWEWEGPEFREDVQYKPLYQ